MRVTYKRILDGTFDEADRIRHELRQLRNDIRAAIDSASQVEFAPRNSPTSIVPRASR